MLGLHSFGPFWALRQLPVAAGEASLMSFMAFDGSDPTSKNVPGLFEFFSNRLSYGSAVQYDSITSALATPYVDLATQSPNLRATQDTVDREFATVIAPLPSSRMISRINARSKQLLWQTSLVTTSYTEIIGNTAARTWAVVYLGADIRLIAFNRSTGVIEIDSTFSLTQDYGYGSTSVIAYALYVIGNNKIAIATSGDVNRYLHIVTLSEAGVPTFSVIGPYTTVTSVQLLWQSPAIPNKVYQTTQDNSLTLGNVMLVEIDTILNTTTFINSPGALSIESQGVQFNSTGTLAYVLTDQGVYEFSLPGWSYLGKYGDPNTGIYANASIGGCDFYWYDGSQIWAYAGSANNTPVVQWEIGDYGDEPTRYVSYGDTYINTFIADYYHQRANSDLSVDYTTAYDMWASSGNGNTSVLFIPANVATPPITYSTTPPAVSGTFNALNIPTPITLSQRVTWYQINYSERLPWHVYLDGQTTTMHVYIFDSNGILLMTYHPSSGVTGFSPYTTDPGTYYIAFVVTNDATADSRVTFASRGFQVSTEAFPGSVGSPIIFSPYVTYGNLP